MRATLQPSRHFVHTQVSLDIHSGTVLYFSDVALDIFIWFVVTGMFYEISVTLPRTVVRTKVLHQPGILYML